MKAVVKVGLACLLFLSCRNEKVLKEFEQEADLSRYISDKRMNFKRNDGFVFIVNNKNCNSCIYDLLQQVIKDFENNQRFKAVILTKKDSVLERKIEKLPNVTDIIIASTNDLQRYGLYYCADILLEYRKSAVYNWVEISTKTMPEISKMEAGTDGK